MSFSSDEILEIAEQIERNGEAFYKKAIENAAGTMVELLQRLIAMEKEHIKVFHDMRTVATPEDRVPATADPDDLAVRYLRSLAEGKVFDLNGDPAKRITSCMTSEDILNTAISFEKEAVLYYAGIRDLVCDDDLPQIDRIIEEEKKHVVELTEELKKLKD